MSTLGSVDHFGHGAGAHAAEVAKRDARDKAISTARARAALAGFTLQLIDDSGQPVFMLQRWNLTRTFDDLADVQAFLDRVGAPT